MSWAALSWAALRDRPLNSLLTLVILALGTASLSLLMLLSQQVEGQLTRQTAGVDLVAGAKGSPLQLILSSLFHVDVPTGNIPLHQAERLAGHPQVARAVPVALGDSFRGARLVGTEPAFLELSGAALAQGRLWSREGEAVVGAAAARRLGLTLGQRFISAHGIAGEAGGHEDAPYEIVGILAPTGRAVDRLILTDLHSIWAAHGLHDHEPHAGETDDHAHADEGPHTGEADDHDHADDASHADDAGHDHGAEADALEVTAVLIRYRSPLAAVQLPDLIDATPGLQAAVPALEVARLTALLGTGADALAAFVALLMATAGLSLFVAMSTAMAQRRYDIAMMRVMGAGRAAVTAQLLLEGAGLAGAGAVLGLIAGHAAVAVLALAVPDLAGLGITGFAWSSADGIIFAVTVGLGLAAAAGPAWQAYRTDIAHTLAEQGA
ncbi:MAG: ABC transporter permease [Rhodothalassiaceae bacterium]